MMHEEKVAHWIGTGKIGTEIGAGASPMAGLDPRPIYVDCSKEFGAVAHLADLPGHACDLPFRDHSLDYVIASHVLEQVANPVAALAEWYRIVRPGGIIYIVVPNRLSAFDRTRELTTVAHMLDDYLAGATARDATHIDEFALGVDWERYRPGAPQDDVTEQRATLARGMHAATKRGEEIDLHFHTFEPSNFRGLLETLTRWPPNFQDRAGPLGPPSVAPGGPSGPGLSRIPRLNWEIVDFVDAFPTHSPDGILAVLRAHKGWRARADADALRLRANGNPRAILREDAQPFDEWASKRSGLGGVH